MQSTMVEVTVWRSQCGCYTYTHDRKAMENGQKLQCTCDTRDVFSSLNLSCCCHTRTHAHTHTRTHAHMHTRTHAHTHTRTHAHTHTHTHTHTHIHTHTHLCAMLMLCRYATPRAMSHAMLATRPRCLKECCSHWWRTRKVFRLPCEQRSYRTTKNHM